jgi:PhnB protein
MSKPSLIEQLNIAIDGILAGSETAPPSYEAQVEGMLPLVSALRDLPDPAYRRRLKLNLETEAVMTKTGVAPVPAGFHTVTPYIVAEDASALIDFVKAAFGAEEQGERAIGSAGGIHAAVRIGESMMMIGGGGEGTSWRGDIRPTAIHLFVNDADEVYRRALEAGAVSLGEPRDLPYGERAGFVKDRSGTEWYIAQPLENWHGRNVEGLRTFAMFLHPNGASRFIAFLQQAFGAVEVQRHDSPEGVVLHAKLRIGDTVVEMSEEHEQWQHIPAMIHMYVPNVDAVYESAIRAGAVSLMEPEDQPYGDRMGGVKDPFGYEWYMATHIGRDK